MILTWRTALLGGALMLLLTSAAMSWRDLKQLQEDSRWVAHTYQVLNTAGDVQEQLAKAEAGQRGYVLTGQPRYLKPYQDALASLETKQRLLRDLVKDNSPQGQRIERLESLIWSKLSEINDTIQLRHSSGFETALERMRDDRSKQLTDQISKVAADIDAEEYGLLSQRQHQTETQAKRTGFVSMGGSVVVFLLLALGTIAIERDVRRRQRLEANLRAAEELSRSQLEELRRLNSDLEQFAYSASHDLQEPMRNVAIYSQLIQERYRGKQLDEAADEFLGYLVEGAQRMLRLVDDLLAYTRAAGMGEGKLEIADANTALRDALSSLRTSIEESGASITSAPLPDVCIKPSSLQQLFQNLIGNSIKYRRDAEAPSVHVSAEQAENYWTFAISDNGIGMDPQYTSKIFGIFKRLHGRGKYSGNGIGLAICKRIVEREGGKIWVESQLDRGSTFYFRLPGHTL
jgi:signal transduction histidine kinase